MGQTRFGVLRARRNGRGLTNDIGATGLEIYQTGYSQADFLTEWRGLEKVKRVTEMLLNSPVIGALRVAMEMTLRDIDWYFVGPTDGRKNDGTVQLLNEALAALDHSWNDHLAEALLFPFYGWNVFTITYQKDGSRWLWKKFKMLGHDTIERWLFDDDSNLTGMKQWSYLWDTPIPWERMLLYRFRVPRNDPEGESVLRPAWIPYYYVKNIQAIEAIGVERNLTGLPVVEMPMGADPSEEGEDFGRASEIVRNLRNDEQAGVVLPPPNGPEDHHRWRLTLMAPAVSVASRAFDTNMIISRYEKRMLMAALSQFLMLGMDNVGSLATFKGGSDFHAMLLNSVADIIGDTFSKFAVPRLLAINGLEAKGYRLEHSQAGTVDLDLLTNFLARAGNYLTWTPQDEQELRARARFPQLAVEDIVALQEEREAELAEQQAMEAEEDEDGDDAA